MNTKVRAFRTTLASAIAISLAGPPSLVFASNAAPAGDTARAESLNAEAVDAFERKDYEESIRLFKAAYDANPEPNYLFNIGRVYEEKGDLENAVKFYQQFVGQAGVDLEARETALQRLKILRDALDQTKAEEDKGEQPDQEPADDTSDDPTQPAQPIDDGTDSRKKKLRIAGYSLMGVGAAALIVGGVFGGLASNKVKEAEEEPLIDLSEEIKDDARTQARVADAMFITGGILAAGGLVLVLVTLGKSKGSASTAARLRDRRTAVAPYMSRQRIGVGLTHRF